MVTRQKKSFDCIQSKRKAQAKIYQTVKKLSPEEEIAYFRRSIEQSKFSVWWKSVPTRAELSTTT